VRSGKLAKDYFQRMIGLSDSLSDENVVVLSLLVCVKDVVDV
jgi:hypothetical protein